MLVREKLVFVREQPYGAGLFIRYIEMCPILARAPLYIGYVYAIGIKYKLTPLHGDFVFPLTCYACVCIPTIAELRHRKLWHSNDSHFRNNFCGLVIRGMSKMFEIGRLDSVRVSIIYSSIHHM